jgi:hypothetical protein
VNTDEVCEALDDISLQVNQWQNGVVEEIEPALNDMAEVEEKPLEAETVILAAKLFLQVTDRDWKQAEGLAAVLQSYFSENQSNRGETLYEE